MKIRIFADWESIIEAKDAPILAAAVIANVDRILSLNTRDFTQGVADQCGIPIQMPAQFIQDIRNIINLGIWHHIILQDFLQATPALISAIDWA